MKSVEKLAVNSLHLFHQSRLEVGMPTYCTIVLGGAYVAERSCRLVSIGSRAGLSTEETVTVTSDTICGRVDVDKRNQVSSIVFPWFSSPILSFNVVLYWD